VRAVNRLVVALGTIVTLCIVIPRPAAASTDTIRDRIANRIDDVRVLSQGARLWLKGPTALGPPGLPAKRSISFGTNVDAADPSEDLIAGQSETAIAASGQRVVAAWNDATGQAVVDSIQPEASVTGVGFSSNGGASFRDLVGLSNDNPDQRWTGDPTVVAIDSRHFVVGSLYWPSFTACSDGNPATLSAAISVGTVTSAGTGINFSSPIVVAEGANVCERFRFSSALLDKEFLSYDPASRTLAMSYTAFLLRRDRSGLGQIEVVRAHVPSTPARLTTRSFDRVVVWREEPRCHESSEASQCGAVNQGAYPTVAPGGDIYVAWERNYVTNLFRGDPYVYIHAAHIAAGAAHPVEGGNRAPIVVTEGQRNSNPAGGVKSLDGVLIAGYNGEIGNDYPRVAWNAPLHRLVVEWNDASAHPLGDIWMRTFGQGLRNPSAFSRVNSHPDFTLHLMPAVSVRADGTICSSWYDRRLGGPDSPVTDYFGECRRTPARAAPDFRITTGSTDWANTSEFIEPNFGDYTDNTSTGNRTYFTWSDGRIGVPQPFVDSSG
jgi:hypothetical protein